MNFEKYSVMSSSGLASDKIKVSIPTESDVIIGQYIFLTICVRSDSDLPSNIKVLIKPKSDSISVIKDYGWEKVDEKSGKIKYQLNIDNKLQPGDIVRYTIHVVSELDQNHDLAGFTPLPVDYKVKSLQKNPITIHPDMAYFTTPEQDNNIDDPKNKDFSLFSTVIKDEQGNPLNNIEVNISSIIDGKLSNVLITTDETSPILRKVNQVEKIEFCSVYSDKQGNVKFRVYPIKDKPVRIGLVIQVFGVTQNETEAANIYVFAPNIVDPFEEIEPPFINGKKEDNTLEQDLNSSTNEFKIKIPNYNNHKSSDSILFFMKDDSDNIPKLIKSVYVFGNIVNSSDYPFCFPYDVLPYNKYVSLSYVISPLDGKEQYSRGNGVKYVGGQEKTPKDHIYRQYDKVRVYSSIVDLPIDLSSDENEIRDYDVVDTGSISAQKDSGVNVNSAIGLYIIVPASKDPKNKSLPTVGQSGGINLYYTSRTRNNQKVYTFTLNKEGGNIIPIPYCALSRAAAYHDGTDGELFFDYYIDDGNGTKTYSNIWVAGIDTDTHMGEDDLEGCSSDA
ncbi:hypothetical protein [Xenorhabdus lircayensis]|uniref:DUF11 domain-containing protein n=1 Tax=Xenorhabdus lircayensis TaxID=2763499 RepID=A0ABS0U4K3_9GAMM|nr:hypothetical protein [Xenorhabdus lircayensis]MBI6547695.1 hypothetical protein [Xenorhabdus lircayensis]